MEALEKLLELEWKMFHSVNGEDRTSCQEDYNMFCKMRRAQYDVWSEKTVASCLADLEQADAQGINLARQKYIHMMKSTDPEGYEHFKDELPEETPEKEALIGQIWDILLGQTLKMREKYPVIALGGRPLYASEERDGGASLETYQKSELMTYSAATLESLLNDIKALEEQGKDYAWMVQENSVLCLGYPNMEEAEKMMALQILSEFGAEPGSCGCCGGGEC